VRFVNRKEGHRAHHLALLVLRLAAVEHGRWNAHIGQLRHLVLHERDRETTTTVWPRTSAGSW